MEPDEDLKEAVEAIPDGDVDSIAQYDDREGHFVIDSEESDQDPELIEEKLDDAGYEMDGILSVPGMVQQNFKPKEDDNE